MCVTNLGVTCESKMWLGEGGQGYKRTKLPQAAFAGLCGVEGREEKAVGKEVGLRPRPQPCNGQEALGRGLPKADC